MSSPSIFKKMREMFQVATISPALFLWPVGSSISAALAEAAHMAILIPFVQGIISLGFESIRDNQLFVLINNWSPYALDTNRSIFIFLLVLIFLTATLKQSFSYFAIAFASRLVRTVVYNIRKDLFARYLRAGKKFFDRNSAGTLHQILIAFPQTIGTNMNAMQEVFTQLCMSFIYLVVMFAISWQLTLLAFAMLPLLNVTVKWIIKRIEEASARNAINQKRIGAKIFNVLSCIMLVKASSTDEQEKKLFGDMNEKTRHLDYSIDKKAALLMPLQEMVTLVAIITLISIMAIMVVRSGRREAIAEFLVFFYAMRRGILGFSAWNQAKATFAKMHGPIEQILEIVKEQKRHEMKDGLKELDAFKLGIEYKNVKFNYDPGVPVFENFNLSIHRGEVVALVGPTGAGKTTVVNLLLRFYDITSGKILLDNEDIAEIAMESLRRRISIVTQDAQLFNDTLKKNITYGLKGEVAEDKLWEAIYNAQLRGYVEKLPNGLETIVGDRGVQLSGGEKQRVSIARAFLKDAEILILDEATSSLDTETEHLVQKAIEKVMSGKTAIIIAHRLTTVQHADRVAFIDDGRVVEEGAFQELLDKKGKFAKFWERQKVT